MAKKTTKKKAPPKNGRYHKQSKAAIKNVLTKGPIRKKRPAEQTLPELGELKDAEAMRGASDYADAMDTIAEATVEAKAAKQAVRSRMGKIGATMFSGHGYDFVRRAGEEAFIVKKQKRGAKAPDTHPPVTVDEDENADIEAMDAEAADLAEGDEA